jgi:transcriptional regulator with XRE-family HTH domain
VLSDDRRREIATFLKIRRTRLQPEEVGLPRGGRRRTPGLRREEVAVLAGLSTEWYTWLEQGRHVRPSADALRRIALALRLESGEYNHLLTLAGYGLSENSNGGTRPTAVSPRLQRLIDELGGCPAWVHGERWDVLAWNEAATLIHGDLAAMKGVERNALYQMFLGQGMRRMLVDWEPHARDCVARFRAVYARNVDDPWFGELLQLLRARSREFAAWWNDHDVQLAHEGVKQYNHPEVGSLVFDYTVLDVADERATGLRLVTYVPAEGTGTREKVLTLLGSSARVDEAVVA